MEFYRTFDTSSDKSRDINGILKCKNNTTFLVNDKEVVNNRGLHGDLVTIRNDNVINIKKRSETLISGVLHCNLNQKYGFTKKKVPYFKFTSLSGKFPSFIVPSKYKERRAIYVIIKFNKWNTTDKNPIGQIEKIIGPVGDFNCETEALLFKNNVLTLKSNPKFQINDDVDFEVDYKTFSIDPEGCKDIDDAFHIKVLEDSSFEVGIHIANVAYYIDIYELTNKINYFSSIYLNDKQINMLSDNLTYNYLSLGDGIKRRSLSLILTYKDNKLYSYNFRTSIVINKALSYDNALSYDSASLLKSFTCKLLDISDISTTKLVEHYMIIYNNLTAKTLLDKCGNTILRSQKENSSTYNYGELSQDLNEYFTKIHGVSAEYILSNREYQRHDSLNLDLYTHATSPIRRFVDIINIYNLQQESQYFIPNEGLLQSINNFNKSLKKFYNNYNKLKFIFESESELQLQLQMDCYIVDITTLNDIKLEVYIPTLKFTHKCIVVSSKLVKSQKIETDNNSIIINGIKLEKYKEIKVSITRLPSESRFNKKIYLKLLEPEIKLY